jgi:hypothetical protein
MGSQVHRRVAAAAGALTTTRMGSMAAANRRMVAACSGIGGECLYPLTCVVLRLVATGTPMHSPS